MAGQSEWKSSSDLHERDGSASVAFPQSVRNAVHIGADLESHPNGEGDSDAAMRRSPALTRMIEAEIIPRLLLCHRQSGLTNPTVAHSLHRREAGAAFDTDAVVEFSRILVKENESAAWSYVQDLCAEGMLPERIFIEVLTPVARQLGVGWEEDLYDFAEVTIGLCRLHEIMRRIGFVYSPGVSSFDYGSNIVLCAIDEQHLFGVQMVGELFRRAGWNVWPEITSSPEEIIGLVSAEPFDVIGFTASCDATLDVIESTIGNVRHSSINPNIRVLVGGNAFLKNPTAVSRVGADTSAEDGIQAVTRAEALLGRALATN